MQWIYEKNEDNSARFVLGQIFNPNGKTLLCFGIKSQHGLSRVY